MYTIHTWVNGLSLVRRRTAANWKETAAKYPATEMDLLEEATTTEGDENIEKHMMAKLMTGEHIEERRGGIGFGGLERLRGDKGRLKRTDGSITRNRKKNK